ncbi:hypothetical protein GCM10023310_53510 [Paenibacillus vulneris]|uniref:Uncharacterized protein n=1 Tax=Paenibacillus vulneris TaxID=1133364 RepID=A0ABW3UQJ8_9BACL
MQYKNFDPNASQQFFQGAVHIGEIKDIPNDMIVIMGKYPGQIAHYAITKSTPNKITISIFCKSNEFIKTNIVVSAAFGVANYEGFALLDANQGVAGIGKVSYNFAYRCYEKKLYFLRSNGIQYPRPFLPHEYDPETIRGVKEHLKKRNLTIPRVGKPEDHWDDPRNSVQD